MLYIILGIIMVVFAWMQMAFGVLQKYKNEARTQWVRLDALLQTRSSYILKLLELLKTENFENRELLTDIYKLDGGYTQSEDREIISAQAEAVTPLLDQLFESIKKTDIIDKNDKVAELVDELTELEENIIFESQKYNNSIDMYNRHRTKSSVKWQVAILGAVELKGFHLR